MTQKTILLVDDSKSARYALRLLLEKHGYQVDMVESAEAALEALKRKKPDAIFMDHVMPGMDGFEATELIKGNPATAHIPVVMCTSNDEEEYVRQADNIGSLGILPKPATARKLTEMLARVEQEIQAVHPSAAAAEVPAQAPASGLSAKEIEALIRKITPAIIKETVEPLVEKRLISVLNAAGDGLRGEILNAAREQTRSLVADAGRQSAAEVFESRIEIHSEQLRQELFEKIDSLKDAIPADPTIVEAVQAIASKSAATEARDAAVQTARETARTVAEGVGGEQAAEAKKSMAILSKRINILALAAAAVGILAAGLVYFFPA